MQKISGLVLIAFVLLLFILLDLYVFQGIETLTTGLSSNTLKNLVLSFFWICSAGLVSACVYAILNVNKKRRLTAFAKGTFSTFLSILVAKLFFVMVLLGEDIYRASVVSFNYLFQVDTQAHQALLPHRSPFVSLMATLLAGIPFMAFIHGITKGKYNFKVRRQVLYFDELPESFDGFTIAQISDIHSGSFDKPEAIQKGIDLVNEQKADLFVFTGDLVNNTAREIEPWIEHFSQIKAPFGKYSILGNHDYGDYIGWPSTEAKQQNMRLLQQYHSQMGYKLLLDDHVSIKKGREKITLLGVENWGLGFGKRGDLRKALKGTDPGSFKILLSHDPSHWDAEVKKYPVKVHLTLSGHTHGMQFGIEIGKFKWSPSKFKYPNWAGLASENGRFLYVNRGFGFHGFSGRVGIWPEITVIELRKPTNSKDSHKG